MADNLEHARHSLAHLLAAAVLELYPDAKLAIGPAIDDGFYYDFDFGTPVGEDALPKIEKRMKQLLPHWKSFEGKEVSKKEAEELFIGNQYKLELIDEIIERGEKLTLYTAGKFTDLCRGGHVEDVSKIKKESFKLDRVAGAYWRGDEKNTMLTRIYGLAFATKKELEEYVEQREEAKKRDHRKLGQELDLFVFSDLVGSGLPLWTPRGTLVRHLLDDFVWSLRKPRGYTKVEIPHITKKDLFVTSGHWDKFSDELFKITTREGHEFAMKPMNCPFHTQIYASRPRSWRDLPIRYANTTTCYRDEQSGELSGLSRVRAFAQDDAHVFCRSEHIAQEALAIWDIIETFYGAFNFPLEVRLSLHDSKNKKAYLGEAKQWKHAEETLRQLVKDRGVKAEEVPGEAAFYGPKIDFMSKDSLGREWQVATIQLDFNMPTSFDLTFINEKGEKEPVVMLHAAIMGSLERFLAVYLEHTAGAFPTWLAPDQVWVLPISEKFVEYAESVATQLAEHDVRCRVASEDESIGKRIRLGETQKIPYLLVVGEKEATDNTVSVRKRGGEDEGVVKLKDFIPRLIDEIEKRA